MGFLRYLYLRLGAIFVRRVIARLFIFPNRIVASPDETKYIPSRDPQRKIKLHVYTPKAAVAHDSPSPVLINFHGSGFLIPAHGTDDSFCREISQRTAYTVLDVQYRLAPENPFPAPVHDAEDVVKWVLGQPGVFDASRVATSGFSAGANLALVTASGLFPQGTFRSTIAFYPTTEAYADPSTLVAPQTGGNILPVWLMRFFFKCYVPPGVDARDPRISPGLADASSYPQNVLIITAGYDTLTPEGERLAKKLAQDPTRRVIYQQMDRCEHCWDKSPRKGTWDWDMRCKAYDLAVEALEQ